MKGASGTLEYMLMAFLVAVAIVVATIVLVGGPEETPRDDDAGPQVLVTETQ